MNTTQTTLTHTDTDTENKNDDDTHTNANESTHQTTLAPPDQRGGQGCCPWCLVTPDAFERREDGRIGCGYCDAVIPVGTEWYERGEKIVL